MKVQFTVEAAGQSYMETHPIRRGVAAGALRRALAFARKLGSDRHSFKTKIIGRDG